MAAVRTALGIEKIAAPEGSEAPFGMGMRQQAGLHGTVFHGHRTTEELGQAIGGSIGEPLTGADHRSKPEGSEGLGPVDVGLSEAVEGNGIPHQVVRARAEQRGSRIAHRGGLQVVGRDALIAEHAVLQLALPCGGPPAQPGAQAMAVTPDEEQPRSRGDAVPAATHPHVRPSGLHLGAPGRQPNGLGGRATGASPELGTT